MRWYAFLLYPFAVPYDLVTRLRNLFFDLGWKKSQKPVIPSIVVGNLSVGGTGKTPMVEFLIQMLKSNLKVGVLSRGYGRKTRGFLAATQNSGPSDLGDEPFQIYEKFNSEVPVFVGEDRFAAIEKINSAENKPDLLILDDAFQHRYVKGDLNFLLTTFQKPFFKDFLLPMGRLRESRNGAKRADILLITKSPSNTAETEKAKMIIEARKYLRPDCSIIFTSISYGKPFGLKPNQAFSEKIILLSGLADDGPLVSYVSEHFNLLETLSFPDHHDYSDSDFERISKVFRTYAATKPVILTTEKDAVKVKSNAPKGFLQEIPIFVLPIEVAMSKDDAALLGELIQQKVLKKDHHK